MTVIYSRVIDVRVATRLAAHKALRIYWFNLKPSLLIVNRLQDVCYTHCAYPSRTLGVVPNKFEALSWKLVLATQDCADRHRQDVNTVVFIARPRKRLVMHAASHLMCQDSGASSNHSQT